MKQYDVINNYDVKFNFDCISKKGMISRMAGQININTTVPIDELKSSEYLKRLIVSEMEKKTKKSVFSVTDIEVL